MIRTQVLEALDLEVGDDLDLEVGNDSDLAVPPPSCPLCCHESCRYGSWLSGSRDLNRVEAWKRNGGCWCSIIEMHVDVRQLRHASLGCSRFCSKLIDEAITADIRT